jgi:hypothetical protein
MFTEPDALYRLLPAYIRFRDQKADGELRQLLSIVGDQAAAVQRDLERMYDGWFIETCDEWLIPYIGELVGLESPHLTSGRPGMEREQRLRQVLSARSAVANAIAQRRRKGTLWVLEEIARDIAHWPARAVEFYRQVVVAAHLDHLQPARTATADLRSARRLVDLDTPFDEFCHLGDVRRISHEQSPGWYGIPNVGLFVWRLRPYKVTATAAYCREDVGAHCFTFSALGNDTQLFQNPSPEIERSDIARAENLPVPITRWALESNAPSDGGKAQADPMLYGENASLLIEAGGWPKSSSTTSLTYDKVIPADLSDWSYKVPKDHVAVDPVLGRIAFPPSQPPRRSVKVSYRYGFAMDVGGGEYRRAAPPLPLAVDRVQVQPRADSNTTPVPQVFTSIADAYADWRRRRDIAAQKTQSAIDELKAEYKALEASQSPTPAQLAKALEKLQEATTPPALVVELMVSAVYEGRFTLDLRTGETVAIVAAADARPVIWVPDASPGTSDSIRIRGGRGSRVILDGLLIAGRAVEIGNTEAGTNEKEGSEKAEPPGELCEVWIRHSTLVPGNSLHPDCEPRRPSDPSVILDQTSACLRIEASITGALRIVHEDGGGEPGVIMIRDSIVDATSESRTAVGGFGSELGYTELSVWRSTLIGRVAVHALRYAEDSIFVSRLDVARRQIGCLRFCYVLPESRTPRRYECQPDGALRDADVNVAQTIRIRVAPRFENMRYGSPYYLRLTPCIAPEIGRGAQDESEMGVYHDLFEPQRLSMLNDRLAEFVPASCDAAVVFGS